LRVKEQIKKKKKEMKPMFIKKCNSTALGLTIINHIRSTKKMGGKCKNWIAGKAIQVSCSLATIHTESSVLKR
jgi:hypothetical protein